MTPNILVLITRVDRVPKQILPLASHPEASLVSDHLGASALVVLILLIFLKSFFF